MKRTRTGFAALTLAVTVALVLSGCFTAFVPDAQNPTPTATQTENVAANLRPFYEQKVAWKTCEGDFECATITTPMDWENPENGELDLAIIRKVTTGSNRVGSLLTNPGGPGASGYDLVANSLDFAVDKKLQDNFDIVGFDPRGVGRSAPVACLSPKQMDENLYGLVDAPRGSAEWISAVSESATTYGEACLDKTGEALEFINTVSAARDMDLIRALLGDSTLNYLGYSYGTFLGATYAELYPEKVGRLVLDGAIDPSATNFDVVTTQAKGFESALRAFLDDCSSQRACPFDGTVDESMTTISDLLSSVDTTPIRNSDGRMLGSGTLLTAIITPLYAQGGWPALSQMFTEVMTGDAELAFVLADQYNGRNNDGSYANNSTEASAAYNCRDYTYSSDPAVWEANAAILDAEAPTIGRYLSYGDISCVNWPFPEGAPRDTIEAKGAAPILVVGTTNDPATPYVWAEALAAQLDSGVLVTYNGEGHTGYNKGSSCVNDTVDDYLVNGTVPTKDPNCR